MALQPRDYQAAGVTAIFDYFTKHPTGNPVVAMPTGTGKSVVIAAFLQAVYYHFPRQRVMVLTHVKELIQQNFAKLLEAWPTAPAGVYSAGLGRRDTFQKIILGGIASVAKRAAAFGHVDLVLIDECHLVSTSDETMYRTFINQLALTNPQIKVVGFTATAWRLGHGKITEGGGLFTDVCFDMTTMAAFNWLLEQGYLCPLVPKSTAAKLDVDGVHMRGGEYVPGELQAAIDKHEITYAALKEAIQLAGDRAHWLVFCAGVDHAVHTTALLNSLGISAVAIHSGLDSSPGGERDRAIADWKAGRYQAAVNNNVLTTGIDFPGIDCIIMLRPTASTVLWVQMLGRGTRPVYASGFNLATQEGRLAAIQASAKHDCLVLDFAGNTRRLGPINDPVIPKKRGEKAGEAPVRLCPQCSTYNHASARHCIYCGAEFQRYGPKVFDQASTDDLIKPDAAPVVQVVAIDHVTYSKHTRIGKPPMVRVSYYCGLRMYSDYVGFEHPDGYSQRRARQWWRERTPGAELAPVPDKVDHAMRLLEHLKIPTHLRVWVNRKPYPQILGTCFDGTAFGTQPPNEDRPDSNVDIASNLPQNDANRPRSQPPPGKTWGDLDDDIPF